MQEQKICFEPARERLTVCVSDEIDWQSQVMDKGNTCQARKQNWWLPNCPGAFLLVHQKAFSIMRSIGKVGHSFARLDK